MPSRGGLTATELLAELRAAGCSLTLEGNGVAVDGDYDDDDLAAIRAHKPELIAILAAERQPMLAGFAEPEAPADPPQPAPWQPGDPLPPGWSPPLPRGRVYNGHVVITPEAMAWRARRDAARCKGRPFSEPAPEYVYPEFERDPKRREAMLNGWPIPPRRAPYL